MNNQGDNNKRGGFFAGRSQSFMNSDSDKKGEELQESTEVNVANRQTTLVGKSALNKGEHTAQDKQENVPEEIIFSWQAPEFVYTQKPVMWFVGIMSFFVLLAGLGVFLSQWIGSALSIVMGSALLVWANRKPKIFTYSITNYGVIVGDKNYKYDDFRAFYEYMDYNQRTIDLVPAKRFGTLVSLPLATPEADDIEKVISQMAPKVEHNEDIADKIFRRLRF